MKRFSAGALDGFFVLRPTLMFPLWTMTLAGVKLADSGAALTAGRWALLAISLSAMFGLVYLLNQIRDRDNDRRNDKLHLVSTNMLSNRWLMVEAAILAVVSPLFLVLAGFSKLGLWLVVVFGVAGVLYNFTPLALQRRPYGGVLAGVLGAWLLLRLGEKIAGAAPPFTAELPYLFAFTAGCLLTALPDEAGDRDSGKVTFVVRYGGKITMITASAGFIIAAALSVSGGDWVIALPALATAPALIYAAFRNKPQLAVVVNKAAIFLLSVTVGIYFPAYLAAIALYWPLARWYHRVRFNLNYPGFNAG